MASLEKFNLPPSPAMIVVKKIARQLEGQTDIDGNRLCLQCRIGPVIPDQLPGSDQLPCANIWNITSVSHIETSSRAYITTVDTNIMIWWYYRYLPLDHDLAIYRQAYIDRMLSALQYPQSGVTGNDGLVNETWWSFNLNSAVTNDITTSHLQSFKTQDSIYAIDPPLFVSVSSIQFNSKAFISDKLMQEALRGDC